MKIPLVPPTFENLMQSSLHGRNQQSVMRFLVEKNMGASDEEYIHWDKLRHLEPPAEITTEQWWFIIKLARKSLYKILPFDDKHQKAFVYAMPDLIWKKLHDIDRNAGNILQQPGSLLNAHVRDSYLTQSIIEEAITSSQLEGASTTRKVAKEMLLTKRTPRDLSEQMIFNNYEAMQFVREMKNEKLTESMIVELQGILTKETLDDPAAVGKLRQSDDISVVDNRDNVELHVPPRAKELKERLKRICDFANEDDASEKHFIHPIVKAVILHFMLAYDHPFEDGNGRTARALFYWYMTRKDYWLMEYVSISRIIKKAKSAYAKAFLYTETDDNDITYFINHQLNVIVRSIEGLHEHMKEVSQEIKATEEFLNTNEALQNKLNHRQVALIKHALKHPQTEYLIGVHQQLHNVTYETARTDLLSLTDIGLLIKRKRASAFIFLVPPGMRKIIENYTS